MPFLMLDEAFATVKELGRVAGYSIRNIPDEFARFVNAVGGVDIPTAGYMGPMNEFGTRAVSFAADLIKIPGLGEVLSGAEHQSLYPRSPAVMNAFSSVLDYAGPKMKSASAKAATELSEALGKAVTESDVLKASRRLTGVAALVAIGAGALIAGTKYKEGKRYDDIWRYGDTENERQVETRQNIQRDITLGQMVPEMSSRRNYSFNMRNDKHDHLFRG
jgi:hypothetical protein